MRRPTSVEAMLLGAIVLWAMNLTVTRYVLTHGFQPLAYATVRYGLATAVFAALTLAAERTLRVARRDVRLVLLAALAILLNQVCFIYALKVATASVIGIVLGATPIFTALLGLVLRTEQLTRRFWAGTIFSFAGVGLVAAGAGSELSGDLGGILLGLGTAVTWAVYSVTIAPLMARYSPSRISTLVLGAAWVGLAAVGFGQTTGEDYGSLGWEIWLLLVLATLGPLVLTNMLWFRALYRIGPARATLAANLQPFLSAVVALVVLSEKLTALQVLGGVCIAAGIVVARRRPSSAAPAAPVE